jgi:hypothetical protein
VQGISGGVSLPISGTVTANLAGDVVYYDDPNELVAVKSAIYAQDGSLELQPIGASNPLPISGTVTDANIGQTSDSAATTDTGTFSVIALIKRSLQNWTSLLAKIPALVSGRIPVDGSGVTQPISVSSLPLPSGASTAAKQPALGTAGTPSSDVITVQGASAGTALNTKETQPTGDYVINVGTVGNIALSGSAVSTAGFDAGTTADYIAVNLEGGATVSAGFFIDASTDNVNWVSGVAVTVYYDLPATSATDAYSYRSVSGQLFGGTRSGWNGRFIIPCTQAVYYSAGSVTYRYFRITTPAAYGSLRYKFVSYKSPVYSIGVNPGGLTRVNGRVDIGYVANLPTLSATVTQATATSLRAQAEAYQGGTAVGSANPLQVTLANTATNATAVKVDGSAVTQPVSGTVTTTPQQGSSVGSTTFTSTTPSSSVVSASGTRKGLTIYNAGFGDLYICAGSTCTTTSFQVKLVSGDYWECPPAQVTLAHAGVYGTAGTAYVTTIT